ncbi:hypothetical protein C0991_006305 [Blastosporella zonata]|nr:hypothetical protein C0991_006305 [Blastosporella zonata]
MIVAFFLRRWRRNRITEEDFNPDEFVRSPNMTQTPGSYNDNPFEPTPPNAAFRAGHNVAPSISSGPNMAGQGAYAYGSDAAPYSDAAYAAGGASYGAGAAGGAAYGTYDHATADDAINGAYSSQPQVQAPYNAEAYGSFAYSTEGPHAVTTPSQQFHPYSSQEYQAHYHDNAPALVAGAPAVAANRGRVPSIIDPEDAYGGI